MHKLRFNILNGLVYGLGYLSSFIATPAMGCGDLGAEHPDKVTEFQAMLGAIRNQGAFLPQTQLT
jgi:hypothetical protein